MSKLRANMVCENTLAKIAREFKLNDFLMLGQGEEKTGGRDRDSIISDMFEAFIGIVKKACHDALSMNKNVVSFKTDNFNHGLTIVELKKYS